jgi:hypothetical protein
VWLLRQHGGKLDSVMANLASLKVAAALFIGILFVLFASYRPTEQRQNADIDGYVYEKCVDYKPVSPVGGAVVSTSVDSTTAATDATGHFHLLTKSPVFNDEFYPVTVRANGLVINDTLQGYQTVPIAFVLSPPEPVRLGSGKDKSAAPSFCAPFPFGEPTRTSR